jgi:uncharacterized repeat protein (TIGR02543 family)
MSLETAIAPTKLCTRTLTETGYTFAGWSALNNGTGTYAADTANYPLSASAAFYAE